MSDHPVTLMTYNVVAAVTLAAHDAVKKHGILPSDPLRACAIMVRECGEALNEALLLTVTESKNRYDISKDVWDRMKRHHMYDELAQVAATAMMIMDQLEREGIL